MNPQFPSNSTLPSPQVASAAGSSAGVPAASGVQGPGGYGAVPVGNNVPSPLSPSAVEAGVTTDDIRTMGATEVPMRGDDDGMDKLWEVRAKQIILATATDPYLQHQQLMQLKAEFMQKQYNKTIKLT